MRTADQNFLSRREQWLQQAVRIIQTHAPRLNESQSREVAMIAIKSWQDLRQVQEWAEASDFILTL